MEISERVMKQLLWTVGVILISSVVILFEKLWWKPRRIRSVLEKQGIKGPKPSFPFGNVSEMQNLQPQPPPNSDVKEAWVYSIFPYFHIWKQRYGPLYLYSTGTKQHLYVEKGALVKDMAAHMAPDLGRPLYLNQALEPIFGDGVLRANGKTWVYQRNVIIAELFMSKIKTMLYSMEDSAMEIVKKWDKSIEENKGKTVDLVIEHDLKVLSEDILSKACFGSNYGEGKHVFERLGAMQTKLGKTSTLLGFFNLSFLSINGNKEVWRMKKEVDVLITKMINDREIQNKNKNDDEKPNDLLQKIIESSKRDTTLNEKGFFKRKYDMNQLTIDLCKNIYFAGSESTALATTWALWLIASYPEWQQRLRSEILEAFDYKLPHSFSEDGKLQKLKLLTMVIQESFRLYGPAVTNSRETFADMKFGDLLVPKGTYLWMFVPALHRDTDNWGPDAAEFKPERFANGLSKACKYPQAYIPFGFGSRNCLGQNFTMTEIKIALSLLLYHFSFEVSPDYRHCPVSNLLLIPKYGIRLLVTRLNHTQK
uniref:Cytochrome P450 714A2-like n=1 Tax=Cicer arietinum TaxID=3827 RepID=A0A1S2XI42_CICAR|nr:cytochrome P450 714A2-like [Cicer arietinum]